MKAVCTITPSWLLKRKKDFVEGLRNLEEMDFSVINRRFVTRLPSPAEKARQIHAAFLNQKVDLILAQRGGYSAMKILPRLDFALIRRHPKILAGFSDVSALLNAVHERTGLITLHSPMIINFSEPSRFTVRSFCNALSGFPQKDLFRGARIKVYRSGSGRGILKGGNLSTLTALMGTEWEIDTERTILFFEDVDEKLYRIDRLLTQWILAGKFRSLRGMILGDFRGVRPREVYEVISSQMNIAFPVVYCPNIGHVRDKITLPVGARAELSTPKRSLLIP